MDLCKSPIARFSSCVENIQCGVPCFRRNSLKLEWDTPCTFILVRKVIKQLYVYLKVIYQRNIGRIKAKNLYKCFRT